MVFAVHNWSSWGSHCGNWAVTQDNIATRAFSQGFTLKKVWKISKGKGISAWDGAQDHVKNADGDSVGSCPLEQDRRYHRKEVWKKKILLLSGLNLSFRENGSWWYRLFSHLCQGFLLSGMRQNNFFCLNFLLSKIFYMFVSGGEEMMLEGNIFSINT